MSPRGFWCKHFALKSWYSKHWKHLGAYKKCRSWVPPKIHWIRIYIFSRYLGHSRVYWSVYRKGPTWLILISYPISIPKKPQNTLTYFITSLISLMVHCLNQERPIIATLKNIIWKNVFQVKFGRAPGLSPPGPSGGKDCVRRPGLSWPLGYKLYFKQSCSTLISFRIGITVWFPLKRGFCCFIFPTIIMIHSAHPGHWYLPYVTQEMGSGTKPGSVFLKTSLGSGDVTFKMSKPYPVPRRTIKLLSYSTLIWNDQERH